MKYKHIFFDLDHTIWDFETNATETLKDIYLINKLDLLGVNDFNVFAKQYSIHNEKLWDRYTKGFIKQDELRWKRIWLALLDFKIANEPLAKTLSAQFLEILPTKTNLFDYTREILEYLKNKGYYLHLITNGFENIQFNKLKNTNLTSYFTHVITSEASNSLKPKKEIFDYALQKANATTKDSIMIGDNIEADILGAKNAGLDTIFVNHLSKDNLPQANYTIFHLQQLENIL